MYTYRHLLVLVGWLIIVPSAYAGFWDTNFVSGKVRTEFAPNYGTGANYVNLWYTNNGLPGPNGCLWQPSDPLADMFGCPGRYSNPSNPAVWQGTIQHRDACGGSSLHIGDSWLGCLSYSTNTYFSLNSPAQNYWVVHANNDPSFDQCRKGPPGASEPIIDPVAQPTTPNLYKIAMEPIGGKNSLSIIVVPSEHDFTCAALGAKQYTIPYLSVGAHKNHGNGGLAVGSVNPISVTGSEVLRFKAQMRGHVVPSCLPGDQCGGTGSHAGILLAAQWGGVRRMLFLDLFNEGALLNQGPSESRWSWPLADSMFWPGGDIAFLSASELPSLCPNLPTIPVLPSGTPGIKQQYDINMSKLFSCASGLGLYTATMPNSNIEVESVDWFVETAGSAGLFWLGVEDPEIVAATPPLNYSWAASNVVASTQAAAKSVCRVNGKSVPTVAQFNADKAIATSAGTTIKNLFGVPSQLHWLDKASCLVTSGTACDFYAPTANTVSTLNNNSFGVGNAGNGAFPICINVTPPAPPSGLTYIWTPTGKVANTLAAAVSACSTIGGSVPTIAQFNADKAIATGAGTNIKNIFGIPAQLHWINSSCPATAGTSCSFYQPSANSIGTYNNGPTGIGNNGNGAFVACVAT